MTPREQIEQRAGEYAWVGDMYDPKANFQAGAEYGYNLALERVCEYLKFFINVPDEVETNENGEPVLKINDFDIKLLYKELMGR